jgi:uncharacterized protein YecT (DUF1311 family)
MIRIRSFLMLLILMGLVSGLFPPLAQALTDAQYQAMTKESAAFRQAEQNLNDLWKTLSARLASDRLDALKNAQRDWVVYVRDTKAQRLAEKEKIPLAEAYARVTEERTGQLKGLFPEAAGAPASWTGTAPAAGSGLAGTYASGMGTLWIKDLGGGRIEVRMETDWPPQNCSGSLPPTSLVVKGNQAILSDGQCEKMVLTFGPGKVDVEEHGSCEYHGMNCNFDGEYKKIK